ncbi:MAG: hypothetical protein Q9187_008487 [Circinaria calcarea]
MPAANRRPQNSFAHSRSTPNLPRLDGFQIERSISPEESTPRAINGYAHILSAPGAAVDEDDAEEDDDADFQSHYSLDTRSSSSSDDSGSDEVRGQIERKPFFHRSNSSFLNSFAPPFYNRPPTPLPPSPSLTSLLRPSFSATPSRPTTPDSSENDTPNDTEAAVAKSARTATTVPRASPKVPTYEYYGFVLYLVSSLSFLIYLLWSYLPSPFLHQLGIYYYPNRWWSLAIPSFLVMTIVYIYVALACYNTEYLTLPLSSIENIVDEAANIAIVDADGKLIGNAAGERYVQPSLGGDGRGSSSEGDRDWKALWDEGTDAVMDVPIGGVCEVLYGGR